VDKRERHLLDLSERLPVDVYPASNGEFLPEAPTAEQHAIMALAEEETEKARRRFGMSRRDFVRTAAAMAIGTWAIDVVTGGRWGRYALADESKSTAACDLAHPGAQLSNLPGEFIFDVQSHHVDSGGSWRATNPSFHVFFTAIWEQAGPLGGRPDWHPQQGPQGFGKGRELDPIENLSRYHYLKELYLDSSTNMCVLSSVPSSPERQPLPQEQAAITVQTVNELAGNTPRCVMHAFVMPNRGAYGPAMGTAGRDPVFMNDEFEQMEASIERYPGILRGWKVYTPWGDVPNASGWFLDDPVGEKFLARVVELGNKHGVPKTIAAHKGFALPGFDQNSASPRDVGPAAKAFPEVDFIIYHSGYDSEAQGPYPGHDNVSSAGRGVNAFVKSLWENELDATHHIPPGLEHGNSPNVWGEIGATWRTESRNADRASHLLGKLITWVGPRRVVWGTDSLWFGSPQPEIVRLRTFEFTAEAKELYNLPHGLDGDRFDPRRSTLDANSYRSPHPAVPGWPTDGRPHPERSIRNGIFGRNIAEQYGVDPDAARAAISCDEVQQLRDAYLVNPLTPDPRQGAPFASNRIIGERTPQGVLRDLYTTPWSP
jgi:uncharacterized protein